MEFLRKWAKNGKFSFREFKSVVTGIAEKEKEKAIEVLSKLRSVLHITPREAREYAKHFIVPRRLPQPLAAMLLMLGFIPAFIAFQGLCYALARVHAYFCHVASTGFCTADRDLLHRYSTITDVRWMEGRQL